MHLMMDNIIIINNRTDITLLLIARFCLVTLCLESRFFLIDPSPREADLKSDNFSMYQDSTGLFQYILFQIDCIDYP